MNYSKISKGISLGVRIAALLLLVLFFVPSITVSCSGVDADVSGLNAAIGTIEVEGEDIGDIDAAPWLFIIAALAIAIGVIASKFHFVTMACSFVNIIMIFVFKAAVNNWVKDNFDEYYSYIDVETTAAFAFHIIFCILIILALAFDKFVLLNDGIRAKMEELIRKILKKEPVAPAVDNTEGAKFCASCGHRVLPNAHFCGNCGATIEALEVAEETAASEEPAPAEETN